MDFITRYKKIHTLKINCNITEQFKIQKIMFGFGGSNNIILIVKDNDKNDLVIKVIPDMIYFNFKVRPNQDQLEIKLYQFLTNRYILTERTPHIIGIYNHQKCTTIDRLLKEIRPSKKACPTYEDKLKNKIEPDVVDDKLCTLALQHEMKIVGPTYDIILLEYCSGELHAIIGWNMNQIRESNRKNYQERIDFFINDLRRIFFQVIFTLALIKDDYPGFLHGDFFVRNILIANNELYNDNDYIAYYYNKKIFYLLANGLYAKINDFGTTIIANELEPDTMEYTKLLDKYYHLNPFSQKTDIFNFFHDIYDGQNLGTYSIKKLAYEMKIPPEDIEPIKNYIDNFIDVATIDKINANNWSLLDNTWFIDGLKVLEDTVQTPSQYLDKQYFGTYQELPDGANIVKHYNKPQ